MRSSRWFWSGSTPPRAHSTIDCETARSGITDRQSAPRRSEFLDSSTVTEYRAHFDAEVAFANGGRADCRGISS